MLARLAGRVAVAGLAIAGLALAMVVWVGIGGPADATGPDTWHNVGATGEPDFSSTQVMSFDSQGSTYPVAFREDGQGDIRLRGIVLSAGAAATTVGFNNGAPYQVELFDLPCGYQPESNVIVDTSVIVGELFVAAVVQISDSGTVSLLAGGDPPGDDPTLVSLGPPITASGVIPLDTIGFEPEDVTCP